MARTQIRFYLDEDLSPAILDQLRFGGIDVIRGPLGDDDTNHLQRAAALGRVLCTTDEDYARLHTLVRDHAGIIKGVNTEHTIGDWVRYLRFVHEVAEPEDLRNSLEYVFYVD